MIRSVLTITIILVVVFFILMLIPTQYHGKVVASVTALSAVLVAYGIYVATLEYEENVNNQNSPANYAKFMDLQNLLVKNDQTKQIYREIYGNQADPDKHNVIIQMATDIQEANDFFHLTNNPTLPQNSFITVLRSWANTKSFRQIWPTITQYFKPETDKLVTMLQSSTE